MSNEINPYAAPPTIEAEIESDIRHPHMRIPDVLADAWTIFTRNFIAILTAVVVVWLPLELLSSYCDYYVFDPEDFRSSYWLGLLLESFIGIIATAAVISIGVAASINKPLTGSQALAKGIKCWGAFFLTNILVVLIVVAGFLLLILPGIYAQIRMIYVNAIVVAERRVGMSAIRRSFELTLGRMWFTLSLCLVLSILFILVAIITAIPFIFVTSFNNWIISAISQLIVDVVSAYFTLCFFSAYRAIVAKDFQQIEEPQSDDPDLLTSCSRRKRSIISP